MSKYACGHVINFKSNGGLEIYNAVHSKFIACTTAENRKRKILNARCFTCSKSGHLLHSCLHCVFFACYGSHIQEHLRLKRHYLSVDLTYGNIYCSICKDFEYDDDFASIACNNVVATARSLGHPIPYVEDDGNGSSKRARCGGPEGLPALPSSIIGLRGLVNLDNTCYMNCIVQVLMRTPLLRNFLMAERHECKNTSGNCVVCEVAKLFQEFYCGERGSIVPHRLLYLIWMHRHEFTSNEQQDAQEFFIAMLDVMHGYCAAAATPTSPVDSSDSGVAPPTPPDEDCNCIIDKVFKGRLQSDVVCQKCKNVSTTIAPCWDISLDISCGKSLKECLECFTRLEHLGHNDGDKIMCSNCKSREESTKQDTIKTLPIVASFHLKRFEQTIQPNKVSNKKISTFISFPEYLDMTPFLSRPNTTSGRQPQIFENNGYTLFAVVNHRGDFNGGHYTAFVRFQHNMWFKCDDHKITRSNLKEVLTSQGYLLFYHKTKMEYE